MMHHAITKRRRRDSLPLGLMHIETNILTRLVTTTALKFFLDLDQVGLQVIFEIRHGRLAEFAAGGFLECPP
jgi:hypothetical protein